MGTRRSVAAALTLVLALASCSGGTGERAISPAPEPASGGAPWPAPSDPLDRIGAAGLEALPHEFLDFHVHAHLDVFVNGEPVEVPAGIGIDIEDPGVQTSETELGPAYGGIEGCVGDPCISPLHTHSADGVLHTESPQGEPNTLGQFFTEWGVALDSECVGGYCSPEATIQIFVDGNRLLGEPADVQLLDGREIAIVIGTPPDVIPDTFDASNA
jgi:hypothetical protein